jgi:hypothetical protein
MEAKGLPPTWTDLIMKTVTSGKVGINVNWSILFHTSRNIELLNGVFFAAQKINRCSRPWGEEYDSLG